MANTDTLTDNQIAFCMQYVFDWNATRAYLQTFDTQNERAAAVNSKKLLSKTKIQNFLATLKEGSAERVGISKDMVAAEYKKLAFSNIARLHNTWIDKRLLEDIDEADLAAIAEISTKTERRADSDGNDIYIEYVKVRLHDKKAALAELNKMYGWYAAEKVEHGGEVAVTGINITIKR